MVALAGWMNRRQQEAIEYLRMENRILREKLGHKRLILNESQKRRLSQAAAKLGRQLLREVGTLFSPDTLLKWNRWFIARKYDGSDRRGKRGPKPTKANMIRKLVLRMAAENPSWGYGRINGELKKLGYDVHWQTVRRVMLDHGLLPDPDKPYKTTWKTFIQSHWDSIAACDFFSVEAWGLNGEAPFHRARPRPGAVDPLAPAPSAGIFPLPLAPWWRAIIGVSAAEPPRTPAASSRALRRGLGVV